jgi:hypothetical protein
VGSAEREKEGTDPVRTKALGSPDGCGYALADFKRACKDDLLAAFEVKDAA